jgi:hypothetical protein
VKRNTQAIVRLAAEKSRLARLRVVAAIAAMQAQRAPLNFNTICLTARVSKTFLYDPKHSDLAGQIRSLRQANPESPGNESTTFTNTNAAKEAQIVRLKEGLGVLKNRFTSCRKRTNFFTAT